MVFCNFKPFDLYHLAFFERYIQFFTIEPLICPYASVVSEASLFLVHAASSPNSQAVTQLRSKEQSSSHNCSEVSPLPPPSLYHKQSVP